VKLKRNFFPVIGILFYTNPTVKQIFECRVTAATNIFVFCSWLPFLRHSIVSAITQYVRWMFFENERIGYVARLTTKAFFTKVKGGVEVDGFY